ncbi:MBL fold metallo-hydrolase [Thiohalophilus sp.]|uniref:MBL fold metallo-hydrolase n=1 Tax=Thiohalophilus sp. TaxID=3028392 RepID=UPI002ACD6DF2|nr:MBL fold metallo-hydrolase [Thiohalophilus sp.]MDZ7804774.1 MBL fold metallo-hydrolase [Thiohalophilus sp.]
MKPIKYLVFALVFMPMTIFAHEPQLPLDFEQHTLEQVSQHIHVVHGTQSLPNPQTRGFMNNPSAILTHGGIIIVDPGSSAEIGRQLLTKLRKITDKPVIAVFNTHVHGDHWLGNQGIRETYPEVPIYAHTRMLERVEAGEGGTWVQLFMGMTEGAVEGTRVIGPNIGLSGGEVLSLDGITLKIHHTGHAHTDHDLMIEVVNDKGLFFGDIVSSRRVPNSDVPQDASFKGSIAAIKAMLDEDIAVYIPGHGRSGGREVPESSLLFLEALNASVTHYFNQGLQSYEMKDKVIDDLAEYQDWNNFNEIGRVINFVFQEVEQDNF